MSLEAFIYSGLIKNDQGQPIHQTKLLDEIIRAYVTPASIRGICTIRRQGKSTAAGLLCLYEFLQKPNSLACLVSGSGDQIGSIFAQKILHPLRKLEQLGFRFNLARDRAENLENNSLILAIPPTSDTSVGKSVSLLVLDECRAISEEVANVLFPSASEGRIFCLGTAGAIGSWWHRLIKNPTVDEHVVEYSDLIRSEVKKFRESERRRAEKSGELSRKVFMREWENTWLSLTGTSLVTPEAIRRASRKEIKRDKTEVTVITVDLSISRDLSTILVGSKDRSGVIKVLEIRVFDPRDFPDQKVNYELVETAIQLAYKKFKAQSIYLDRYQAFDMTQRLRSRGFRAFEYQVTSSLNQAAFTALAEQLNSGSVIFQSHERLEKELAGLQVKETVSGFQITENKQYHRDVSFCLAVACLKLSPMIPFDRELDYRPAKKIILYRPDLEESPEQKARRELRQLQERYNESARTLLARH